MEAALRDTGRMSDPCDLTDSMEMKKISRPRVEMIILDFMLLVSVREERRGREGLVKSGQFVIVDQEEGKRGCPKTAKLGTILAYNATSSDLELQFSRYLRFKGQK